MYSLSVYYRKRANTKRDKTDSDDNVSHPGVCKTGKFFTKVNFADRADERGTRLIFATGNS